MLTWFLEKRFGAWDVVGIGVLVFYWNTHPEWFYYGVSLAGATGWAMLGDAVRFLNEKGQPED